MYYDAPICWRERHDAWSDEQSGHLFSYLSPEQRVPVVHPLRTRAMTDDVLRRLSPRFDAIYAATGRPSIPPEHLLRTLLLQVLYSVRSERRIEQADRGRQERRRQVRIAHGHLHRLMAEQTILDVLHRIADVRARLVGKT
jgi:transposase